MSPARSHVEQSRNTLLFAICAKEVTTNAQVNLVVSEKALVRQLQKELARMENELKNLGSASGDSDFYSLLKQKEEVIAKVIPLSSMLLYYIAFLCPTKKSI